MKIQYLIIFLIISFHIQSYTQSSFFITYNTDLITTGCKITETQAGNLLILSVGKNEYTNQYSTKITKYGDLGNLISSIQFDGYNGATYNVIEPYKYQENQFIIGGYTDSIDNQGTQFRTSNIKIIDNNLNVLQSENREPEFETANYYRQIIPYSDSIIFLLEEFQTRQHWPKVWKNNLNTNTWSYYQPDTILGRTCFDMLIHDSIISVFYSGNEISNKYSYNHIIDLDLSLNFLKCTPQPDDIYLYSFAEPFTDSTYLLSGMAYILYQPPMNVCRSIFLYEMLYNHDSICGAQFYPEYPEDTILYPFMSKNVTFSDYKIAIGGQYNIVPIQYPTQPTPCWVQLTLFDYELNMEKQLYYGDGVKAYYGMDIIATSDGGFAMCGLVNDPQNTTNPQPDMFVLKVNSEGLMTGNNEREQPEVTEVILWPNPGNDVIHLKSASQLTNASFELYNPSGILCLTQKLSAGTHQTINTEHLTAGIYPYRIINGNRVVKTGKWIKK